MVDTKLREFIREEYPQSVLFDNPSYDRSISGITTAGNVVYDLDKMILELAEDDEMTEEDALDFIEYNTIRSLPYTSKEGISPVIMVINREILDLSE